MALRADDVDVERDRALVRRFQAGDDEAFGELYQRYHDRLERFCRKRVGDDYTAEEVAQEAFTRALRALPDLGGEMRFYPWVSVIAARLCVDTHRRQARSQPEPIPDTGPVAGGQDDIVDAVDASLAVVALNRLAPRHQDVLHLREVEGWSYRRIADHYGVKLGTVETLLFRARRALRREFQRLDGTKLVAVPVLGRIVQGLSRLRDRLPSWLPSTPTSAGLAAVAGATAAAVALTVVPGGASVRAAAPSPAVGAAAAAVANPRGTPALSPSPVLQTSAVVLDPAASAPLGTAEPAAGTVVDPSASASSSPGPSPAGVAAKAPAAPPSVLSLPLPSGGAVTAAVAPVTGAVTGAVGTVTTGVAPVTGAVAPVLGAVTPLAGAAAQLPPVGAVTGSVAPVVAAVPAVTGSASALPGPTQGVTAAAAPVVDGVAATGTSDLSALHVLPGP